MRAATWILLFSLGSVYAQVDNGVIGDPFLDCGDGHIEIRFDTRTPFRGLVFVEDKLNDPACRSPPADGDGVRNTSLRIGFEECAVHKRFSESPRGLFVTTRVIIAFHPEFLTKVDRLYQVQCFYMEMERRLEKQIEISMAPPTMHTANIPMPVCKYEVLDGSPNGPPVLYTTVGQMVYHKWTCESQYNDTFCMTVHSCTVNDGNGDVVRLLDEKGCAQDKYLLNNLEYISDLMAGREAHVYKYADRENMYFDCEITISIKEPGQEFCEYPTCPEPPRRRRLAELEHEANISNLASGENATFEIDGKMVSREPFVSVHYDLSQFGFCSSGIGAVVFVSFNLFSIILSASLVFNTFAMLKSGKPL
ncbi:unnamed protein product, partial [Mesorhabditis spiculigera]